MQQQYRRAFVVALVATLLAPVAACGDGPQSKALAPDPVVNSASVSGVWVGEASLDGQVLSMRFEIIDADGELSGTVELGDPDTAEMIPAGDIAGRRNGRALHWETTGGATVDGQVEVEDEAIRADIRFTRPDVPDIRKGKITLSRQR